MRAPSADPGDFPPVAGILVLYRPCTDLVSRIPTLLSCLSCLCVVDNAEEGLDIALPKGVDASRVVLLTNHNVGGLAGAYNLAIERIQALSPDIEQVLYLDEDTDTAALADYLRAPSTWSSLARPEVAAIAPLYVERATGLPGAHIQLERFRYTVLPRDLTEPHEVTFLINSMSLWKLAVLRRIGPYDTALAVDHVDTDYCLRAKLNGYRLVLDPTVRFLHSIGKRRAYRFLGRTLQSGGHGPARRFAIGRNTVWLAKRYGRDFPAFWVLCAGRIVYECLGILLAEDHSRLKLSAFIGGILMGIYLRP